MKAIFLQAVLLIALALPNNTHSQSPEPITVAALLHLSGDLAAQGNAFREGIELARKEIEANGGIDGRPVRVVFEDTKLQAPQSVTAARKVLSQDKAIAALVSTFAELKAAAPIFERAKVPVICLWDSSQELEDAGDYSFGIGVWTAHSGELAADFARSKLRASSGAVMYHQDEWADTVAKTFRERFESSGGKIKLFESFPLSQDDFRSIFARLKQAEVDVLYAPIGTHTVAFFRQLRESAFSKPVIESDNLNDALIAELGPSGEGIYQTQSLTPNSPETAAVAELYRKTFQRDPKQLLFVAWGYDGLRLLADSLKAKGVSTEAIRSSLAELKDYRGASGVISMSQGGSSRAPLAMFRVKNGKLVQQE